MSPIGKHQKSQKTAELEAKMAQEKHQAIIDELEEEIQALHEENEHLKAENARLGGTRGIGMAIQRRACVNCSKILPDGPAYFPGYFEEPSTDLTAERWRHACIYCRAKSQ
jgi:hypothetical protein